MNKVDLDDFKKDVKEVKFCNFEEFYLISQDCFFIYLKSFFCYGKDHEITKDIIRVWKEFLSILNEERKILNYLLKNNSIVDMYEVDIFMNELDKLNIETIKYYMEVLDGIETACDMKTEWRAKRPRKDFLTLIETGDYRKRISYFTLSFEDIKSFLGYEEEFWDYIDDRTYLIDEFLEDNKEFYGVNMKVDENSCLSDIKVFVPYIVNLETALVNVHEFNHAYLLYKNLGNKIKDEYSFYEQVAKDSENVFQKEYVLKKYRKFYEKK